MSFPVNTQQAKLLPRGGFCTCLSPADLKSDAQNGPGSKIQSKPLNLSAESLLIYRIYLFSADPVAKILKFLFLCFQKNLLLVKYSEIAEYSLLSQCFETVNSLPDRRMWELCRTFSQNPLSSWDFSDY